MLDRLALARNRLKDKKGFSIVEILIVVTIIGFFVGISMMNNANNAENAKIVVAKADCRNILAAVVLYNADMKTPMASSSGDTLCTALKSKTTGRNGTEVGPWMATCPSSNPWGNAYTYSSTDLTVTTLTGDNKTISTNDLGAAPGQSSGGGTNP